MVETLKLGQLLDREAARITFSAYPEIKSALVDYAGIYGRTYGTKENVAELILFMLESFINADPGFKRVRRELGQASPSPHKGK